MNYHQRLGLGMLLGLNMMASMMPYPEFETRLAFAIAMALAITLLVLPEKERKQNG
jgi:hypothetical protein